MNDKMNDKKMIPRIMNENGLIVAQTILKALRGRLQEVNVRRIGRLGSIGVST